MKCSWDGYDFVLSIHVYRVQSVMVTGVYNHFAVEAKAGKNNYTPCHPPNSVDVVLGFQTQIAVALLITKQVLSVW